MLTFGEFVVVKGRDAGYNKGDLCEKLHITPERLMNSDKIKLGEIKKIRDLLNIPEWEIEKHVLEILRK